MRALRARPSVIGISCPLGICEPKGYCPTRVSTRVFDPYVNRLREFEPDFEICRGQEALEAVLSLIRVNNAYISGIG